MYQCKSIVYSVQLLIIYGLILVIQYAIGRKIKSKREKRDHWLDYASDKFDEQLIKDIKQVLRVLILYLPVPVFWALYDQQVNHFLVSKLYLSNKKALIKNVALAIKGSRWTFQAARMDGTLGSITILPDQFQIANPLLIIALVPIFDSVIYPFLSKCGLVLTPLKRMSIGGLLAALAFVVSGAVELLIEVFSCIYYCTLISVKKYFNL